MALTHPVSMSLLGPAISEEIGFIQRDSQCTYLQRLACFGEFGLFCGEFRKKFSSHTVLDPVLELCPDQLKLGI